MSIGNGVTIRKGTVIGDGSHISDGAVLGQSPFRAKTSTLNISEDLKPLEIGRRNKVGANAVLYRGSVLADDVMVADLATVREKVVVGEEVMIGRGVTVENGVTIGKRTKIQTNAYITAYSTLEENVFIAPCVTTTNDNYMGRTEERFSHIKGPTFKKGARVGGGAIILPGITIAEETFVAAGALVTKDTKIYSVVKGIPAKICAEVPPHERLS